MMIPVLPGRFQPPLPHHLAAYRWVVETEGDCYVAMTGRTDDERSPLTFEEREEIWGHLGLPPHHILRVTRPYDPDDPEYGLLDAPVLFCVGEKDARRVPDALIIPNIHAEAVVASATAFRERMREDDPHETIAAFYGPQVAERVIDILHRFI